jgi:hypothetical protein
MRGQACVDRVPLGTSAIDKEGVREHSNTREVPFSEAIEHVRRHACGNKLNQNSPLDSVLRSHNFPTLTHRTAAEAKHLYPPSQIWV